METTELKVDSMLLCRSLELINNTFYILGGGWESMQVSRFPGVVDFQVAIRLSVPFTETNRPLVFEVLVEDEDGNNILPAKMAPQMTIGRPVHLIRGEAQVACIPLIFTNIVIPQPSTYTIRFKHNNEELASTWFRAESFSRQTRD